MVINLTTWLRQVVLLSLFGFWLLVGRRPYYSAFLLVGFLLRGIFQELGFLVWGFFLIFSKVVASSLGLSLVCVLSSLGLCLLFGFTFQGAFWVGLSFELVF